MPRLASGQRTRSPSISSPIHAVTSGPTGAGLSGKRCSTTAPRGAEASGGPVARFPHRGASGRRSSADADHSDRSARPRAACALDGSPSIGDDALGPRTVAPDADAAASRRGRSTRVVSVPPRPGTCAPTCRSSAVRRVTSAGEACGLSVAWLLLVQTCVQTSALAQAPVSHRLDGRDADRARWRGRARCGPTADGPPPRAERACRGRSHPHGADGRALITFLDGTTVTVEPGSESPCGEIEVGGRERSHIQVLIMAGTVWARIANLLGGRGTVSLASNTHAAIAHDGLIGAEQRPDGSFVVLDAGGDRGARRCGRGERSAASSRGTRPRSPRAPRW